MAFPALIQKIFDLRHALRVANDDSAILCSAIVSLSEANIRMSMRIAKLELGTDHPYLPPVQKAYMDPEGYDLFCGAKVAPLTLMEKGHPAHPDAALTVVIDNFEK